MEYKKLSELPVSYTMNKSLFQVVLKFDCTVLFKAGCVCWLNAPLTENSRVSVADKNQFTSNVLAVDSVGLKPFVFVLKQVFLEDGTKLSDSSLLHLFSNLHCSGTGIYRFRATYTVLYKLFWHASSFNTTFLERVVDKSIMFTI